MPCNPPQRITGVNSPQIALPRLAGLERVLEPISVDWRHILARRSSAGPTRSDTPAYTPEREERYFKTRNIEGTSPE